MKKNIVLTLSLLAFLPLNLYAQKAYTNWLNSNKEILEVLQSLYIGDATNINNLKTNDVKKWIETCNYISEDFKQQRYSQNTLDEWEKSNNIIYNKIKGGEFPRLDDKELINAWKEDCDDLKVAYNNLKKQERGGKKRGTKPKKQIGKNLDPNDWKFGSSNSSFANDKTMLDAFYFCVKFPLNTKFHKAGVENAYSIASNMIKNGYITEPDYIDAWNNSYKDLLKNYETYNNEVINYLKKQKQRFVTRNWTVNYTDVEYIKDGIESELPNYGQYYGGEVCIRYLDYVLNKYFDVLESAAAGDFELSEGWLNFFIKNELEPTQYND